MVTMLLLAAALSGAAPTRAAGASTIEPETERAWDAYVAATEARIARELSSARGFLAQDFVADAGDERARALSGELPLAEMRTVDASGRPLHVPGASIVHWRGSVFVPGVTIDRVLARARHPSERGPFQSDVVALRVLDRRPDGLTLFIKMTRRKLVTVTYNTEHEVIFRRETPNRASSRSVATRIAEVERTRTGERELPRADDHGFLWHLNSYWRYEQVAGGVLVELESLSLGRDIPLGLGALVRPLIASVARESIERTLVAFRHEQMRADFAACAGCRR